MTDTHGKPFERGYGSAAPNGLDLSESDLSLLAQLRDEMLFGAPGSTPVSLEPIETGMEDLVGRTQRSAGAVLGATVSLGQPLDEFGSKPPIYISPTTTEIQTSDQGND